MTQAEARKLFERTGAVRDGHFELRSGRHTLRYVDFGELDRFLRSFSLQIGRGLADLVRRAEFEYDAVLAPAGDAEILAPAVGAFYVPHRPSVSARKLPDGSFILDEAAVQVVSGKLVLLVDDVVTSGGSFERLTAAVQAAGGVVAGRAAVWRRSPRADAICLIDEEIADFVSGVETCPACRQGRPLDIIPSHEAA